MALLKICDRCGKILLEEQKPQDIRIVVPANDLNSTEQKFFDLCDDCYKELIGYISSIPERKKDQENECE